MFAILHFRWNKKNKLTTTTELTHAVFVIYRLPHTGSYSASYAQNSYDLSLNSWKPPTPSCIVQFCSQQFEDSIWNLHRSQTKKSPSYVNIAKILKIHADHLRLYLNKMINFWYKMQMRFRFAKATTKYLTVQNKKITSNHRKFHFYFHTNILENWLQM